MYKKTGTVEVSNLLEIPLNEVDLVLLDLDNTLYEYKPCHEKALNAIVENICLALPVTKERVIECYYESRKLTHDRHHGTATSHSRLFYIQGVVETLIGKTDAKWISSLYSLYWDTYCDTMKLFDGALGFLENCTRAGIPVVLVTDMTAAVQFKKIGKLGIQEFLQFVVTSEEAGQEKPASFIFELAIEKAMRFRKGLRNIIVVGDNPEKDFFSTELFNICNYLIK